MQECENLLEAYKENIETSKLSSMVRLSILINIGFSCFMVGIIVVILCRTCNKFYFWNTFSMFLADTLFIIPWLKAINYR